MDHGSPPHADAATDPIGAARLTAALPAGWAILGRARQGSTAPGAFPSGCHVLAGPEQGIALLDIAPGATPNAVPRLRRALAVMGFGAAFPGFLPIWHGRLGPEQLHLLPTVLREGFAAQPPMSLQDDAAAWMGALQEALDADPGWEAAGRPKRPVNTAQPVLPPDDEPAEEEPRRTASRGGRAAGDPARWRKRGLAGLAFCAVFLLGLGMGALLQPPAGTTGPAEAPAVASAPAADPAAAGAAPVAAPRLAVADAPPPEALPAAAPAPVPPPHPSGGVEVADRVPAGATPEDARPPPAVPAPATAEETAGIAAGIEEARQAAVAPAGEPPTPAEPAQAAAAAPGEDLRAGTEPPLPPPPAMIGAPPPPPRAAPPAPPARQRLAYDRRCGDALFRWSQGQALSPAEMAFVREGCAWSTARR